MLIDIILKESTFSKILTGLAVGTYYISKAMDRVIVWSVVHIYILPALNY